MMGQQSYFGYKFRVTKFSGLDLLTYVTYEIDDEKHPHKFFVRASSKGIELHGISPVISDRDDLEEYAKLIGNAWTEHTKLVPKIHHPSEV